MGNIPMSILWGDGSHPKVIIRRHISFQKNIIGQLGHFRFPGHPTPDAVQHGRHDPTRSRSVVWQFKTPFWATSGYAILCVSNTLKKWIQYLQTRTVEGCRAECTTMNNVRASDSHTLTQYKRLTTLNVRFSGFNIDNEIIYLLFTRRSADNGKKPLSTYYYIYIVNGTGIKCSNYWCLRHWLVP